MMGCVVAVAPRVRISWGVHSATLLTNSACVHVPRKGFSAFISGGMGADGSLWSEVTHTRQIARMRLRAFIWYRVVLGLYGVLATLTIRNGKLARIKKEGRNCAVYSDAGKGMLHLV